MKGKSFTKVFFSVIVFVSFYQRFKILAYVCPASAGLYLGMRRVESIKISAVISRVSANCTNWGV